MPLECILLNITLRDLPRKCEKKCGKCEKMRIAFSPPPCQQAWPGTATLQPSPWSRVCMHRGHTACRELAACRALAVNRPCSRQRRRTETELWTFNLAKQNWQAKYARPQRHGGSSCVLLRVLGVRGVHTCRAGFGVPFVWVCVGGGGGLWPNPGNQIITGSHTHTHD